MLTLYLIVIIIAIVIWRYGIKKYQAVWTKKRTVIDELIRQREEIKLTSDELRMPMARMTSILGDLSMKVQTLEIREQLNSLHFQLLQIITRISEMQTTLERTKRKASRPSRLFNLSDMREARTPRNSPSYLLTTTVTSCSS